MTWAYRIAKKKDLEGKTRYSLVEAFMNDEGEIWGYTPHSDILSHIQHDDFDDDADMIRELFNTLNLVMGDALKDMIDEDTFVAASSGFEDDIADMEKHMKVTRSDN